MKYLFIFFMLCSVSFAQIVGPKLAAQEKEYAFGSIKEGEIVSHSFIVTNTGGDTLVINDVRASCGCTAAKPEKSKLLPGESTNIQVSFNTNGRKGHQQKHVYITSNDKENAEMRLSFTAEVEEKNDVNAPKLVIEESTHDFGTIKAGKVVNWTVNFKNSGASLLEIKDVKTSCGCTAAVVSGKKINPGESGSIKIEFDSTNRSGKTSKTISVQSNDPGKSQPNINYFCGCSELTMAWFKRSKENIASDSIKKELPDGLWEKCPPCGEIIHKKQLEANLWTCTKCDHHFRIGSAEYISFLLDKNSFKETDKKIKSADPLAFTDTKKYSDSINDTIKKTGINDAVRTGYGKMENRDISFACMDFKFIGGSMGSVVGEKISRAADRAYKNKIPLVIISQSGGARMMEGALSLMQMAKTSSRLARLAEAKIPYISVLTDPTTGGTTASYAMLGDINIAEPKALIGFAGPRVIRQTIGKDLPEGFQTSEFLLDNGFLDFIVHRKELKSKIATMSGSVKLTFRS